MKKTLLNWKKKSAILVLSAITGLTAMSASAGTYTVRKNTSGGNGGRVSIVVSVFGEKFNPAVNVSYYGYGAKSYIDENNKSHITSFRMTGKLYKNKSSVSFSKNANVNSVLWQKTSDKSGVYNYCAVTVETSSSAFGYSRQECNHSI